MWKWSSTDHKNKILNAAKLIGSHTLQKNDILTFYMLLFAPMNKVLYQTLAVVDASTIPLQISSKCDNCVLDIA